MIKLNRPDHEKEEIPTRGEVIIRAKGYLSPGESFDHGH